MSDDHDARIADLEIRITHQEDTIDSLTDSLVRQQRILDRMHEQMESLRRRLESVEENNSSGESEDDDPEPPPPHY